jgi:ubiquinone/menaquinone biosynthesis C-methylase UbiE
MENNITDIWNKRWQVDGNHRDVVLANFGNFVKDLLILSKNLLSKIPLNKGDKILDIGGATGKNLKFYFDDKSYSFYVVDISKEALKNAQKNGFKTTCINLENSALPFPDNFFNLVIAQELIEHLYDSELLLREVIRILKRNGIFYLTTPNIVSLPDRLRTLLGYKPGCMLSDNTHIRFFTHHNIKCLLKKHGFKIIFSGTQGVYLPFRLAHWRKDLKIPIAHKVVKNLGQHVVVLCKKVV